MPDDKAPGIDPAWLSALSAPRFETYRQLAGSDEAGLLLYGANVAQSSAFYGPLQAVEVTLRNVADQALRRLNPGWLSWTQVLRGPEIRQIADARDRVVRQGKTPTHDQIVAELSFGFWTGLFANAYDTDLWRLALHRIFYPRLQRATVHDALDRLRTLRNRIAHHEPIVQRRLVDDDGRVRLLLESLNPVVARWADERSRVLDVLALPADEITRF